MTLLWHRSPILRSKRADRSSAQRSRRASCCDPARARVWLSSRMMRSIINRAPFLRPPRCAATRSHSPPTVAPSSIPSPSIRHVSIPPRPVLEPSLALLASLCIARALSSRSLSSLRSKTQAPAPRLLSGDYPAITRPLPRRFGRRDLSRSLHQRRPEADRQHRSRHARGRRFVDELG